MSSPCTHAGVEDESDVVSYLTDAPLAHAIDHAEEDVPSDASAPDADIVPSEEPRLSPEETSSSAQALQLADPSPHVAHPIDASSQALQRTNDRAQNLQAVEELPFSTSPAPDEQPAPGTVPPDSPEAPLASSSHDASLADLHDGDGGDEPPDEPHRRASDTYEDVPPAGPDGGAGVLQGRTAVLDGVEPISRDLSRSPSRWTPAGDPDVRGEDAADVLQNPPLIIGVADDGGGHSAAPGEMDEDGGAGAGVVAGEMSEGGGEGTGGADGEGADEGGQLERLVDAAVGHLPDEDTGPSEHDAGTVVEEEEHTGDSAHVLRLPSSGKDMDIGEE